MQRKTLVVFVLCLLWTVYLPLHTPNIRVCSFCPLMAVFAMEFSYWKSLAFSMGLGLFVSALSESSSIGSIVLSYSAAMFFLYRFRQIFAKDNSYTLALYSALMASIITLLQLFQYQIGFVQTFFTDAILLTICDACYAYVCVFLPLNIYIYCTKKENIRNFASLFQKWHKKTKLRKG